MSSAVELERDIDRTDVPFIVRGAVKVGLITAIAVLLYSLVSRFTGGVVESALKAFVVAAGAYLVTFLPGKWTRARTIEGIAGAAGIGLAGTVVYLIIDVTLLQTIGTYTNRFREIGGGSNWWYHPVWWMVGTFLPWMGAFIIANQAARGGVSVPKAAGLVAVVALVLGAVAVVLHVPHAEWSVPTFGVAIIPALAVATAITGLGQRRA
ncbi:MAG: hypothetical protein H6Q77_1361 [Gemmatimonadetes bacterium]|jgi:hypothetical protein|nr:hypothetical protein [Gemmatimonadota bacterium]